MTVDGKIHMAKFVNPTNLIAAAGVKPGDVVADLGCGSGFYTLAAARMIGNMGNVHAVDIQESKLTYTQSIARQMGFDNVMVVKADLDKPLQQIPTNSCDYAIVASIIHEIDSKEALIKNAYRILKTGGKALAVEWKKEYTIFGPNLEKRVSGPDLEGMMIRAGFHKEADIPADKFHYAMLFIK